MRRPFLYFSPGLFAGLAVGLCKPLYADQGLLVAHSSAHPITALFGLPAAAVRSSVASVQLSLEHSNVFMGGDSSTEQLLLDGETTQLHARYSLPISSCWQADASMVYLSHTGGFLDKPIEDWHRLFGFPNAERHLVDVGRLDYHYESVDSAVRRLASADHGFGDMQLSLQRLQGCQVGAPIWRVGMKLGLASDDSFYGSGETDFYVDWQSSRRKWTNRIDAAASIGLLAPGKAINLPEQRQLVSFGSLGAEFHWSSSTSLIAQLDWHSPIFDSELEELGRISGQLTMAARKKLKSGNEFELSFAEDIVTDTAPDFSVRMSWRQSLGRTN